MMKAILFDLDNTLLFFNEMTFLDNYLSGISLKFSDIMPEDMLKERLLEASRKLMLNNGSITNAEYFMNTFCIGFEEKKKTIWERFIAYYNNEFDQFQSLVTQLKGITKIFNDLRKIDLMLIIASNPVWPLLVQEKRLRWAGLGHITFDLITHIENMYYCKPRLEYYGSICQKLNIQPYECLMVGNDPVNDIIAGNIGMNTYLTTDAKENGYTSFQISRMLYNGTEIEIPQPTHTGPLHKLVELFQD